MSSIPWVSSPSSSHQCPHGVVGGGGCGQPTRWPTFPIPPDHRARTLEIPGNSDPNIIPDGDFSSSVRVTGGSVLCLCPGAASDSCGTHGPQFDPMIPWVPRPAL